MQADDVGHVEQLGHGGHLDGITQRELVLDVVVIDFHAEAFGDDAQLGADVAVADDAEFLAAGLDAVIGQLLPDPAVALGTLFGNTAQQQQDFTQHQFGDGAGVGEGGVEDGNATHLGGLEVDLIGTDAEAADGDQLARRVQYLLSQLGA